MTTAELIALLSTFPSDAPCCLLTGDEEFSFAPDTVRLVDGSVCFDLTAAESTGFGLDACRPTCDCGNPVARWAGDPHGLRTFACEDCQPGV